MLPQAIRNAVPALINRSVSLFKNSSLAMAIGVAELTHAVMKSKARSVRAFEAYSAATVLYLALSLVIMAIGAWVARHYRIVGFEVTHVQRLRDPAGTTGCCCWVQLLSGTLQGLL